MPLIVVVVASVLAVAPPSPREQGLRISGYLTLGLGVGGIVGSVVANRVSTRASARYSEGASPGAIGFPEDFYAPKYRTLDRRAGRARLASIVLASAGLGLLVVSPVFFGLAWRHKKHRLAVSLELAPGQSGVGLAGRF